MGIRIAMEGAANMSRHDGRGPDIVATRKGREQFLMLPPGSHQVFMIVMLRRSPDDGLLDDPRQQAFQLLRSRRFDNDCVKAPVMFEECRNIGLRPVNCQAKPFILCPEVVQLLRRNAARGARRRMTFKHPAQRECIFKILQRPVRNKGPLRFALLDEKVRFKPAQGVANRRSRNTADFGKMLLSNLRAGLKQP